MKKVVFVLGPPGVGKGTQCRKIVEHYDFVHISAGELLRNERQTPQSQHGELINLFMREGKIVPSAITCNLLEEEMRNSTNNKFLIDGFPRNQDNCDAWNTTIGAQLLFILYIDCPVEVCIERCLFRGAAGECNRNDDCMEILKKRMTTHVDETQPIVDQYKAKNLVQFVDGSKSQDAVFDDIKHIFDNCTTL